MKSQFIHCSFGKLHYQSTTSGKNIKLLLLHATASSAASFTILAEHLQDRFDLIALDFPGHGLSDPINPDYYSVGGLVSVLKEFLDRIQLQHYIGMGNSLGANVLIRSLSSLQGMLGLILEGSLHAENKKEFAKAASNVIPRSLMGKKEFNEQELKTLARAYLGKSSQESHAIKIMTHDIQRMDQSFRGAFLQHIEKEEWPDELRLLQGSSVPFIYIGGAEDAFINPSYYQKLLRQGILTEDRFHLLPDVGHIPHLEDPKTCSEIIKSFSDGLFL